MTQDTNKRCDSSQPLKMAAFSRSKDINWSNNDHCAKYGRNCCIKGCSEYRKLISGDAQLELLHIKAEPRYPEDAYINGVREDNDNPRMPFLVKENGAQTGWCWNIDIDIPTGRIIGWPKDVNAKIHYKVCDCFGMKYGEMNYMDYVPNFMSIYDEGYGDYIKVIIEDGKIKDWNADDCRRFIAEELKFQKEF